MKKIRSWFRKNKGKILIADGVLAAAICVFLFTIAAPLDVEGLEVENSTYSTAELTWDKTSNAASYRVYRSEDGEEYEYLETTTDTSFTDKDLRTGQDYYYKVISRNGFMTSDLDDTEAVEVTPSLETPHLDIETDEGEMKLSYSEVEGAIGYEIKRDGKVIDTTEDTEYIDEEAEAMGGEFSYSVRAYRYRRDPVFSDASNVVGAEMYAVANFSVATSDDDLLLKWTKNGHYSTYRIYNNGEILGETNKDTFRIADLELDKVYDLRLVAFTLDESEQSPDVGRRFEVVEEEMTNQDAIDAAVQWGIDIANDDSFTYGTGKRSHRYGCYFCQTNVGPRKNLKGKSLVNGHSYAKTYCCNPFVHACYAHGAGDPAMLKACQAGSGIAMTKKSFTRYGHWKSMGKLSKSQLKKGDVLVRSGHVSMYIGDGKIVHAAGGGWGANSIRIQKLGTPHYSFVMRYTGTGRGVKYVIKDVDEQGNIIEDTEDAAETIES